MVGFDDPAFAAPTDPARVLRSWRPIGRVLCIGSVLVVEVPSRLCRRLLLWMPAEGHSTTNATARTTGGTNTPAEGSPVSGRWISQRTPVNEMLRPMAGGPKLGFGGYPAWFDRKPLWMVGAGTTAQPKGRPTSASRRRLGVGTSVAVRNRYLGAWSRGFEVVEEVNQGYRIKRVSDGAILPAVIGYDEVRSDPRNDNTLR